jgi:adenosylcobinamide-GDP ribazoletransferase
MPLGEEIQAAVGLSTVFRARALHRARHVLAAGLAFYPAVGLGVGALAAGAAAAGGIVSVAAAGVLGVTVLLALGGLRPLVGLAAAVRALGQTGNAPETRARLRDVPRPVVLVVGAAVAAMQAVAVAMLPPPARTTGLLVAPMLGRWAVVVQCYGGAPTQARGVAAALVGRARFREFAGASVVALGVTLAVGDAVGLLVALVAALTTVGLRVYAHHRLGGLTGRLLGATQALVETVVLLVLALLAQLKT